MIFRKREVMGNLMGGIDLHVHTNQSDGELPPAEVVRRAAGMGLRAVSITDHDCSDGLAEAMAAGVEHGIEVIPGVELSVRHGGFEQVHLLGYFVDQRNPDLENHLTELRDSRLGRGKRLVQKINQKLAQEGLPLIDFAQVEKLANKVISRPHIAKVMTDMGVTPSMPEAFRKYLVPLNIQKHKLGFEEAVNAVKKAGGIPVLAHPNLITADRREQIRLLDDFTRAGLKGLEVYYNNMTERDTEHYRVLALERNLLLTGGSDFHGFNNVYGNLGRVHGGRVVPEELLNPLKESYFQNRKVLVACGGFRSESAEKVLDSICMLTGADRIDGRAVAQGFPRVDPQSPQGLHMDIAIKRIVVLESELKLLRGKSAAVFCRYLDRKSALDLAAVASRCGADFALVLGPESASAVEGSESTAVVLNPESGTAAPYAGTSRNTLSNLLYFTLRG